MNIKYIQGDATNPLGDNHKVIVHICNDLGKWGKGFVLAISKKWKLPETSYKNAFSAEPTPNLGDVQFIEVEPDTTVANIIGQHGVYSKRSKQKEPPIRYEAVRKGLEKVAIFAKSKNASVHMPRIGCGLAGGTWEEIEPIILTTLIHADIEVLVYDL